MVKKNKIHGTGSYTDAEGNVYQGELTRIKFIIGKYDEELSETKVN